MSARQTFYSDFLVPELRNKRSVLANLDYPGDIYRHMDAASVGLNNFEYRDPTTHAPASFMVFGEVLPDSRLNAIGNHFTGRPGETMIRINDNGKTHDVLKLGAPSNPTEELLILFDNQFVVFNNIFLDDCDFDRSRKVRATKIHECSEVTAPPEGSQDPLNRLRVGLPKKFGKPKAIGSSIPTRARPLQKKKFVDKKPTASVPLNCSKPKSPSVKEETVEIGGWYEPTRLPDYESRFFNLVNDKLIQHNVRDIHGDLIPAWDNLDRLRPGTVVGIVGSLYAFNIENGEDTYKRIYNLNAHLVQVLYESDDEAVTAQAESNPVVIFAPEKALDTSGDFESLANKRKAITRLTEEERVRQTTPDSPVQEAIANSSAPEIPSDVPLPAAIPDLPTDITLPDSPPAEDELMGSPIPSLVILEPGTGSSSTLSAIDSDAFDKPVESSSSASAVESDPLGDERVSCGINAKASHSRSSKPSASALKGKRKAN